MIKKIVITVCCSLVTIVGLFVGYKFYTFKTIGYTKVYVASHNIMQRTLISEQDLVEINVPKEFLNEDILVDKEDMIGKYVKLAYSIPKGSLIYKGYLESDIKDLAHTLLKQGELNYDLYTSDIKINTANLCRNMYLDIYLTINKNDKPVSDLLLSNARITGLYDTNNKPINDYDNESKVSIITIAINKDAVNAINKALVIGSVNCIVSENAYKYNLSSSLNNSSKLFEYLQ